MMVITELLRMESPVMLELINTAAISSISSAGLWLLRTLKT